MLDLFGSKRRAILNSEQFQNNLTQVRDLRNLVLQMSQSFTSPALLKRLVQFDDNEVKNIVSVLSFTITANIHNPDLRVLLNHYYEDFYVKKIYKFHFDPSRHRNMTQDEYLRCMNDADIKEDEMQRANLNAISHSLFRTDSTFSLFESYKSVTELELPILFAMVLVFQKDMCLLKMIMKTFLFRIGCSWTRGFGTNIVMVK